MNINLNFVTRKLMTAPKNSQTYVVGALIECIVDGVKSKMSVVFDGYNTKSASTVALRVIVYQDGVNVRSNTMWAKSRGYGYNRSLDAASFSFSRIFNRSKFENYSERAMLTDLANRVSTDDSFVLFDRYGAQTWSCGAGAEPLTIV